MSITIEAEFIPPDHVAAVIARLRDVSNLLSLCGDETIDGRVSKRIAGNFRPSGDPRNAITVLDAGGFPADMPLARPRVSVYHYAASGYQAAYLARLVQAVLTPLYRQDTWFVAAGCVVTDVQKLTGLIPLPLPQELRGWHCRVMDFLLLVNEGVRAA